jgi:hypothetical protein
MIPDLAGYWITPVAPDIAVTLQFKSHLAIPPLSPSNSDGINAITQ